jgi:hypothetical protein
VILDPNDIRRADIRTGSTPDTKSLDGNDIIHAVSFFHFKCSGPYNFFADPNTQAAANTPIGGRPRIDIKRFGKRNDVFSLRGHMEQIPERFGSRPGNRFTLGFHSHPISGFQNTCQHRDPFSRGSSGHLYGTQTAGSGRFERCMVAQGWDSDAVDLGNLKNSHSLIGLIFIAIYCNFDHISIPEIIPPVRGTSALVVTQMLYLRSCKCR